MIMLARPVTLKTIPYKEETDLDLDVRNAKLGRPMSPHLSIYAYQLTSVLSISHRFTGSNDTTKLIYYNEKLVDTTMPSCSQLAI